MLEFLLVRYAVGSDDSSPQDRCPLGRDKPRTDGQDRTAKMAPDDEELMNLDDFLLSPPDAWRFSGMTRDEEERAYSELRGIRYVVREGEDFVEMSRIEEVLGGDVAHQERMPWIFEAQRRLADFQERHIIEQGPGYEIVIRKRQQD